jgi:hypothetical protein
MPTTPIYALPYPAATDPADVPLDMQELAERIALVLGGALSATPPATPFEGQLWALPGANGLVWMFRYNAGSASAHKWEFIGGSPIRAELQATVNTASGTYVDLGGPSVVVPRAGDYVIAFGAILSNGAAASYMIMAPKLGAAAVDGLDQISVYGAAAGGVAANVTRRLTKTLAASATVLAMYAVTPAGVNGSAGARWIEAIPIRVS